MIGLVAKKKKMKFIYKILADTFFLKGKKKKIMFSERKKKRTLFSERKKCFLKEKKKIIFSERKKKNFIYFKNYVVSVLEKKNRKEKNLVVFVF